MSEKDVKKLIKIIKLQMKLLACYRVGSQPGAWLDELIKLREWFDGISEVPHE